MKASFMEGFSLSVLCWREYAAIEHQSNMSCLFPAHYMPCLSDTVGPVIIECHSHIESAQFDLLYRNQWLRSEQPTQEVICVVYRNWNILSNYRLDHRRIVKGLDCPCGHSFLGLRQFNDPTVFVYSILWPMYTLANSHSIKYKNVNRIIIGCLGPENVDIHNKTNTFLGWADRYISWNVCTANSAH